MVKWVRQPKCDRQAAFFQVDNCKHDRCFEDDAGLGSFDDCITALLNHFCEPFVQLNDMWVGKFEVLLNRVEDTSV